MRHVTTLLAAALAAATAILAVPASDASAQELARIYHFTPTDGGPFQAALEKHVKDRIEHEDPWSWGIYQVVSGEDYGDFYIRSGGHDWADFDAYDQGFGSEAGLHFQVAVGPLVKDVEQWITQEDTAHSRLPAETEWPDINLISVTTYHLQPGMEREFNDLIGTIHGAIEGADWPVRYAWADMVAGTGGPQKVLAIFHENWADFEEPETPFYQMLQDELGEDEAQDVMERFGDTFRYVENSVLRWRKDLSIPPMEMRDGGSDGEGEMGGEGSGSGE